MTDNVRRIYILGALPLLTLSLHAQKAVDIEEGYYTMTSLSLLAQGQVYTYDTDVLRAPYGNAADYEHPCGRNGEVAYLYSVPSASASLTASAYYFKPLPTGGYSLQSLSGEAYSYLSMAAYDRHLLCHTPRPSRAFMAKRRDKTGATEWEGGERVVQQFKNAALCDSLVAATQGAGMFTILSRIGDERITPAMSIRRALSDARGAMAVYRVGDNPGEVSPLVADALVRMVDEAQTMTGDKNTTQAQADEMIDQLQQATAQYLESAPTAQNPLADGYYFVVNAYRAFQARQGKEKTLVATPAGESRTLTWGNTSVNDGSTAFRLTPSGNQNFVLGSYDQSLVMDNMVATYDSEGTWTLARSSAPEALMTAANQSVGIHGLYGKNTADTISFDPQGHLYSGYTASWYLRKAYHQVTVPSSGWAVLGTSFPVEVPDGVTAYTVEEREGNLYLRAYTHPVIPARTAVVLHAAKGTYTFASTAQDAPSVSGNVLVPVCEARKGIPPGSMRTLKVKNGVAGFSRVSATSASAGSAYVPCVEGEADFLPLLDREDAVQAVQAGAQWAGQAYDLLGRKANAARQKTGDIYIMDNKKILKR